MPYRTVRDFPDPARENLPIHAQKIYMKAFNSACDQYRDPEERKEDVSHKETPHRVAWSAVKQAYQKENGEWIRKH